MIREAPTTDLRQGVLRACFDRFDGTYASGVAANNKLDLELLQGYPEHAALAVAGLRRLARRFGPDLIVPIPDGANWLGHGLGMTLGVDVMTLHKDPNTKAITMKPGSEQLYASARQVLLVEDVPNQLTTLRRTLAIPWIGELAVAALGVWDRGDSNDRPGLGVPLHSLIEEYLPPMLPVDSEYWEYAG